MDEIQPPALAAKPMPLGARLTNVFVAPGEVFASVRAAPGDRLNWIVPLVLSTVFALIYVWVVFSQPSVIQQMKEAREKQFQKVVASGKITQQQADQQQATIEKFFTPTIIKTISMLSVLIANPVFLFIIALIAWLVSRFALHGSMGYMQAVEVAGLSLMISVLGAIVTMLLSIIYGNAGVTLSPALLLGHFDPANKVHLALAALNVFSIWWVSVLAIGSSRVAGTSCTKTVVWLFALWAVISFGPILLIPRG